MVLCMYSSTELLKYSITIQNKIGSKSNPNKAKVYYLWAQLSRTRAVCLVSDVFIYVAVIYCSVAVYRRSGWLYTIAVPTSWIVQPNTTVVATTHTTIAVPRQSHRRNVGWPIPPTYVCCLLSSRPFTSRNRRTRLHFEPKHLAVLHFRWEQQY